MSGGGSVKRLYRQVQLNNVKLVYLKGRNPAVAKEQGNEEMENKV